METHLTKKEKTLLDFLEANSDRSVSRREIAIAVFNTEGLMESNLIDVHIKNLRGKLGKRSIRSVRGLGYQIAAKV